MIRLKKERSFRLCSACSLRFATKAEFREKTSFVGFLMTGNFCDFDLELRNCSSCGTTLSLRVPKRKPNPLPLPVEGLKPVI